MKTLNYVHCTNLFILNPPLASLFELSKMDKTGQLEDRRKTALNAMPVLQLFVQYWWIITDINKFDTHNTQW